MCKQKPIFLAFEGADGCGKTTQQHLLCQALSVRGCSVASFRDPGSTPAASAIRKLVLNPRLGLSEESILLLYSAARAELAQEIEAWLAGGGVVLCDRWFLSTLVYQASMSDPLANYAHQKLAQQLYQATIPYRLRRMVRYVTLDVPYTSVIKRLAKDTTGRGRDRYESRPPEWQQRLRYNYRCLSQMLPRTVRVNGHGSVAAVHRRITQALSQAFPDLGKLLARPVNGSIMPRGTPGS